MSPKSAGLASNSSICAKIEDGDPSSVVTAIILKNPEQHRCKKPQSPRVKQQKFNRLTKARRGAERRFGGALHVSQHPVRPTLSSSSPAPETPHCPAPAA